MSIYIYKSNQIIEIMLVKDLMSSDSCADLQCEYM